METELGRTATDVKLVFLDCGTVYSYTIRCMPDCCWWLNEQGQKSQGQKAGKRAHIKARPKNGRQMDRKRVHLLKYKRFSGVFLIFINSSSFIFFRKCLHSFFFCLCPIFKPLASLFPIVMQRGGWGENWNLTQTSVGLVKKARGGQPLKKANRGGDEGHLGSGAELCLKREKMEKEVLSGCQRNCSKVDKLSVWPWKLRPWAFQSRPLLYSTCVFLPKSA